jgi:hypothetical protein
LCAASELYHSVQDCNISRNRILDARGAGSPGDLVAIHLNSWGLFGITVRENTVAASSLSTAPVSFLRAGTPVLSAQIGENFIAALSAADPYQNVGYLPVEWSSIPTQNLTQKYGDVIMTNAGKPGWYVTAPKLGYGSLNTAVIVTVATVAGSANATIISNVTGDYRWLPMGMNVIIAGAGARGGELHARILANNGTDLTLDTPAGARQGAANVTYQTLTLS